MQRKVTTPNTDNSHSSRITPVHHPKRRLDEFAQKRLIEFRHHPPPVRMFGHHLGALYQLRHQTPPDIARPLLCVPGQHCPEIA